MSYDCVQYFGSDWLLKDNILCCFSCLRQLSSLLMAHFTVVLVLSNHIAIFHSPSQIDSICGARIDLDIKNMD